MIDDVALLKAMKASIQNPLRGEALIRRFVSGEFDADPSKRTKDAPPEPYPGYDA